MSFSSRTGRQILLLSLIVLIIPMVLFPERLGIDLARASLLNIVYELVFYGFVVFFFDGQQSLGKLLQRAGICLGYRFVLSMALTILITAMYAMSFSVAARLCMFSYLPAVLLHILATPFILSPILKQLKSRDPVGSQPSVTAEINPESVARSETQASPRSLSEAGPMFTGNRQIVRTPSKTASRSARSPATQVTEISGFEKAVRYMGENTAVQLAAVVDLDGLLLANFVREGTDADEWAPYALVMAQGQTNLLGRTSLGQLERVDVTSRDSRLVIVNEHNFYLMVLSGRQSEDLISIRINQAVEMIKKYMTDKYEEHITENLEKIHV